MTPTIHRQHADRLRLFACFSSGSEGSTQWDTPTVLLVLSFNQGSPQMNGAGEVSPQSCFNLKEEEGKKVGTWE